MNDSASCIRYLPLEERDSIPYARQRETAYPGESVAPRINGDFLIVFVHATVNVTALACGYARAASNDSTKSRMQFSILDEAVCQLHFASIETDGRKLIPVEPLEFEVTHSENLYFVDDPRFDLHVCAESTLELESELIEEFFFIWDTYAKESPEKLTRKAQALRKTLIDLFAEAANAPSEA